MKLFVVLFAIVAAVNAYPGYEAWNNPWQSSGWNSWNPWNSWNLPHHHHHHHHEPEHHHVIQVPQPHPIPPLHPKPLHLKVHDESVRLHYDYPHVHHPKLIGYEAHHHHSEPEIHHVHGHGHGHHSSHGHSW